MYCQVLGSQLTEKESAYYNELKESVITTDIMLDKLIIKDVQLTAANDDQYFVFEDLLYQILLCFSRDTEVQHKEALFCTLIHFSLFFTLVCEGGRDVLLRLQQPGQGGPQEPLLRHRCQ